MAGRKEVKLQNIAIGDVREHPMNKKYFRDISEINEEFWETFKQNINELGFVEPLIVNETTMEVISGNQRLKAARELEYTTVPCILIHPEREGQELRMMISSNVMRRELDPFTLWEYVGMLRKGSEGHGDRTSAATAEVTKDQIASRIGKEHDFVSAADIWATLTEEQKSEIKQWFYIDPEKEPTQKELITEVRKLKEASLTFEKTREELKQSIADRIEEVKNLRKEMKQTGESKAEAIRALKVEIGMLKKATSDEAKEKKRIENLRDAGESAVDAMNKASSRIGILLTAIDEIDPALQFKGFPRAKLEIAARDIVIQIEKLETNLGKEG